MYSKYMQKPLPVQMVRELELNWCMIQITHDWLKMTKAIWEKDF